MWLEILWCAKRCPSFFGILFVQGDTENASRNAEYLSPRRRLENISVPPRGEHFDPDSRQLFIMANLINGIWRNLQRVGWKSRQQRLQAGRGAASPRWQAGSIARKLDRNDTVVVRQQ